MEQQEGITLLQLANILNGIVRETGEEKAAKLPVELMQDVGDLQYEAETVDKLVSVQVVGPVNMELKNSSDLPKAEKIVLRGPNY